MSKNENAAFDVARAEELATLWPEIAAKSRSLIDDFLARHRNAEMPAANAEELGIAVRPFQTFMERVGQNPQQLVAAQMEFWQSSMELWQRMGMRALGAKVEPVAQPERGDRRFRDEQWSENPLFDFIKQSYLLTSKFVASTLPEPEGPKDLRAKQLEFHAQQFIDAMSPSNFAATNPAVLQETLESGGSNLLNGLKNLLDDLERGKGQLRIKMTDLDKFEVGKNIGTSPGKVIFENELMQLIQYEPSTEKTFSRPLVIIPPWINKFYILDLQPENSFIKWAVSQGHTVFVISWVNPDASLANKSFDDYLQDGALAAIDAAGKAAGQKNVNLIGYCLGGTLLSCTLAYMQATGDKRAKSATYFASLADFSEPGDLGVFIDDQYLSLIDDQMERDGYLDGAAMATAFNTLRSNDLIWSFVVNNYLMGKAPRAFDLLFWNSDSTRMPRAMHSFYLREMYKNNQLCEPGGISLNDVPIDLSKVKTPTYIVAAKEDHIAPWRSTYASTQLYGGPIRFVLGGSGHIAGIINPPDAGKYGYQINDALPADPDEWLTGAAQHDGSWWLDWQAWQKSMADKQVAARTPGAGELKAIEDAPGRYVQVRDLPEKSV